MGLEKARPTYRKGKQMTQTISNPAIEMAIEAAIEAAGPRPPLAQPDPAAWMAARSEGGATPPPAACPTCQGTICPGATAPANCWDATGPLAAALNRAAQGQAEADEMRCVFCNGRAQMTTGDLCVPCDAETDLDNGPRGRWVNRRREAARGLSRVGRS